jgi:hypothetical protein
MKRIIPLLLALCACAHHTLPASLEAHTIPRPPLLGEPVDLPPSSPPVMLATVDTPSSSCTEEVAIFLLGWVTLSPFLLGVYHLYTGWRWRRHMRLEWEKDVQNNRLAVVSFYVNDQGQILH